VSTFVCCGADSIVIPELSMFLAEHADFDVELVWKTALGLVTKVFMSLPMGAAAGLNMTARRIAAGRREGRGHSAYLQRQGTPESPGDLVSHHAVIYTGRGGRALDVLDLWKAPRKCRWVIARAVVKVTRRREYERGHQR